MKTPWIVRLGFVLLTCAAMPAGALEAQPFFKQSFLNIADDAREAQAARRHLMIVYEQDGCPYCAKMHQQTFRDAAVKALIARHFDAVQLDIFGDREVTAPSGKSMSEKQYARALGLQFSPMIVFLDGDGAEVYRMAGYYQPADFARALRYVASGAYKRSSFAQYSRQSAASAPDATPAPDAALFAGPTNLKELAARARASGKGVALLFDQAGCGDCSEMHGVNLRDAKTRRLLLDRFVLARADALGGKTAADFEGKTLSEAALARRLRVRYTPSVVFFDAGGKEILRHESYLQPAHFRLFVLYVATPAHAAFASFQDWIRARNNGQIEKIEP